jgi:PKD repeat protein
VRLDASQSVITVPGDEIIYFSWDFGDGESKINLPNGVIEHTYIYDHAKENGSFQPKVVITTRKGYTATIQPELPILVKKQLIQVNLSSTSHPTQSAKVGDSVHFLAEFNGLPETMKWDFGDGSTPLQCKGRGCAEVNKIFELP